MRKVLHADIRRVVTKIWPWILLAVSYLFLVVYVTNDMDDSPDRAFHFIKTVSQGIAAPEIIIGFSLLLGIYGDEFKSMAMITVIGRGINRWKYVLSKFLELVILGLQYYVLTSLLLFVLARLLGLTFTAAETRFLICMIIFTYLEDITYVAIAALFYFLSENAAIGLFAYLAFQMVIPTTLTLAQMFSPVFERYHLLNAYVSGLVSSSSSDYILGDYGGGLVRILLNVILYIGLSFGLTVLVFQKKELEF